MIPILFEEMLMDAGMGGRHLPRLYEAVQPSDGIKPRFGYFNSTRF
jgi:hypothetical protein